MEDKKPLVSVVIPSYNYDKYLGRAINSVLSQTYDNLDVVVVDDGSTDNTPEVVRPYLSDLRLRYIKLNHVGPSHARNAGIKEAKGEYIAFLDADDEWIPGKLEKQMPLFQNKDVGVVYSNRMLVKEDGKETLCKRYVLYRGNILNRLLITNFVCFSSSIVRKKCFDQAGLFDEALNSSVDYDLLLMLAAYYNFDYVDEPLVKYHIHAKQLTQLKYDSPSLGFHNLWYIWNKNLNNKIIRKKISWWAIVYSKARLYRAMADGYLMKKIRSKSIFYYLKSLTCDPFYRDSWRGLARSLLTDNMIAMIKRFWPSKYRK